jgi:hypothetical protein
VAVTVKVEVMTGGATTVTAKLPVAVFPVRDLAAVKVKVKGPLTIDVGERVTIPLAASMEAQPGFAVRA